VGFLYFNQPDSTTMKQKIRRTIDTILVPLGAVIFICSSIVVIASPLGLFSISHWLQVVWILLAFCISLALAVFSFKLTRNTIRTINTEDKLSRENRVEGDIKIKDLNILSEKEREEIREIWGTGAFSLNKMQVDSIIENTIAREKNNRIEMRNDLAQAFVFFPIFVGIWIISAFVWGPLTGLAIGWLPAAIGGGLVYSIFHSEA
jgi:hypothetical protein